MTPFLRTVVPRSSPQALMEEEEDKAKQDNNRGKIDFMVTNTVKDD